jgi:pimeloyl-ACP methyl ester carboxylesterase
MFSKYVDIEGTAIHYFHTGRSTLPGVAPALDRGELLLFVHDAGGNAHLWHRQLEHLERDHSAVAFDLPAHGRSGATDGLRAVAEMTVLTQSLIEALRLRPFVLVGQGLGGAIGLEIALTAPSLLRALVLVSTPARFEIAEATLDTWRDVMRGRKGQPFTKEPFSPKTDFNVMREVWMEQVQTDPRVRYTDLVACNRIDFTTRLHAVRIPTLVVVPSDDQVVSVDEMEDVQRDVANAKLVVIDDAGHSVALERPEAFNAAIEEWLGEI